VRNVWHFLTSLDRSSRLLLGATIALSSASLAAAAHGVPGLTS